MSAYTKAIASLLTSVVAFIATFGITVPEEATNVVPAVSALIGTVLVYFLPNKT